MQITQLIQQLDNGYHLEPQEVAEGIKQLRRYQSELEGRKTETVFDTLYLDWVNGWLTAEKWAEHYEMTTEQAIEMLTLLKKIYESKGATL